MRPSCDAILNEIFYISADNGTLSIKKNSALFLKLYASFRSMPRANAFLRQLLFCFPCLLYLKICKLF